MAKTESPELAARQRLPAIDLLRFIAAACVVFYHYFYTPSTTGLDGQSVAQVIAEHGHMGVELFFVISGFVVLWSVRGRSAGQFVRARVLRLYPEFWLSVLVSAAIFRGVGGGAGEHLTMKDIALNLTMVPQYLGAPYVDGVYWTLGVEIKFYVFLWLLALFRQIAHVELWLYAWIASLLLSTLIDVGNVARSLMIHPYGELFAAGGLFFLVFDSGWTRYRAAAVFVCLAIASLHVLQRLDGFIDPRDVTAAAKVVTLVILAAIFAIFAVIARSPGRLHAGGATALAGSLTYPLYLLHNTGRELPRLLPSTVPSPVLALLGIAFSLAISYGVMILSRAYVLPSLRRALDGTGALFRRLTS